MSILVCFWFFLQPKYNLKTIIVRSDRNFDSKINNSSEHSLRNRPLDFVEYRFANAWLRRFSYPKNFKRKSTIRNLVCKLDARKEKKPIRTPLLRLCKFWLSLDFMIFVINIVNSIWIALHFLIFLLHCDWVATVSGDNIFRIPG